MTKRAEYIYLVETSESVNHYEHIYKIGKTTQAPHKRMNAYQKGSKLYLTLIFNDCTTAENELMKMFMNQFEHIKNWGKEYFRGDVVEMMRVIIDYHKSTYKYDDNVGVDPDYVKKEQTEPIQSTIECPVMHSSNELPNDVAVINIINNAVVSIVQNEFNEFVTKHNGIQLYPIAKAYIRNSIRKSHPELNQTDVDTEINRILTEYALSHGLLHDVPKRNSVAEDSPSESMQRIHTKHPNQSKPINSQTIESKELTKSINHDVKSSVTLNSTNNMPNNVQSNSINNMPNNMTNNAVPNPVLRMDQLPFDNKHSKPVPLLNYEETISEMIDDKSCKAAIYVKYDVISGVFDVETIDIYSSTEEFKRRIDPKELKFDLDRDGCKMILNETQSKKFMDTYVAGHDRYIIIMLNLIKQKYKFRPYFSTIYRLHNVPKHNQVAEDIKYPNQ